MVEAASKRIEEFTVAQLRFSQDTQAEYGRWLLSSIALSHSAALIGLFQSSKSNALLETGAQYAFATGLVLTFVSGLIAWTNWTISAQYYAKAALHMMGHGEAPNTAFYRRWANVSLYACAGIGTVALILLPIGVITLSKKTAPKQSVPCEWISVPPDVSCAGLQSS